MNIRKSSILRVFCKIRKIPSRSGAEEELLVAQVPCWRGLPPGRAGWPPGRPGVRLLPHFGLLPSFGAEIFAIYFSRSS